MFGFKRRKTVIGIEKAEKKLGHLLKKNPLWRRKSTSSPSTSSSPSPGNRNGEYRYIYHEPYHNQTSQIMGSEEDSEVDDEELPNYFEGGHGRNVHFSEKQNFEWSTGHIEDPYDDEATIPRSSSEPQPHQLGRTLSEYRRKRQSVVLDPETAEDLDRLRDRLRMEQPPAPETMDGIRASMDVQGLTTAEGLLSMIPKANLTNKKTKTSQQ